MADPLIVNVTVADEGQWQIRLLSASTMAGYTSNTPESVGSTVNLTLACAAPAISRAVWGNWKASAAPFWWVEIRRNDKLVVQSPVMLNPHHTS